MHEQSDSRRAPPDQAELRGARALRTGALASLGIAASASIAAMAISAGSQAYGWNAAIAMLTGGAFIGAVARLIFGAHRTGAAARNASETSDALAIARGGSYVVAGAYFWASLSLLSMYYLTDLSWYHAYQYAIYLGLPGLFALWFARRMRPAAGTAQSRRRTLTLSRYANGLQFVVALFAPIYLVAAGKIGQVRADWAANHVFAFGGLALAAMSALLLWSGRARH